jgi:acyl-CoA reductase-like NAD-dependent aldehyde dehydrogenase
VFHAAGLPPGCLNTIYHQPSDAAVITSALIAHPAIKKINFTGSTRVGSIIASLGGKYLKPTVLELGGKAPAIICEDADIRQAATQCALGAFLHAGQICMSTERIIVNAKVADKFREALKPAMSNIYSQQGQGTSGQLFSELPVKNNQKLLADAISKGATVLYGDPYHVESNKTKMRPVVLEAVTPTMDIYHTESFGPTVSVIVVQSDEEAIGIANDTVYGLSSAVFTEDLRRGLRIAKQIESGAVHINSMTVHDESSLPHGGFKQSGFGRFNSLDGLKEWVHTKVITWKD